MDFNIGAFDIIIIIAYLVGIVLLGVFAIKKKMSDQTSDDYFLASRSLKWGVIGAALFAANISTIHLIGFAESGFKHGLVDGLFEWLAIPFLVFLGFFIAPYFFRNRISTIPEWYERRFNGASRTWMVVFAILTALLIHIGISLYAGAELAKQFFGLDEIYGIIFIAVLTGIYTVVGGLKAVAITETVQTVLLIGGAIILTMFGIFALPDAGVHTFAEFKAKLVPDTLSILRPPNSPANPPEGGISWYAAILGYFVLGAWYWFSDQTIVQRALGAKTEYDAKVGPMFTAILKVLPVLFFLLPGVLAFVIFSTEIGDDTKNVLPFMIDRLVPVGLKGLIIAALLAALMSSVAAAINSASTLFSIDIVQRIKPETDDKKLVLIGRYTAVVIMVLAIAWSTQADKFGDTIIHTVNSLGAMIAPPIAAVFMFGMFWKRGTAKAANITFAIGLITGIFVFLLDFPYENLMPGFKGLAESIAASNGVTITAETKAVTGSMGIVFMMQAWWKFVLCSIIMVGVSFMTPKPNETQVATCINLKEYWPEKYNGLKDFRIIGLLIIVILVAIWAILEMVA
ncbi:sodium:solute symporter family transporter [Labilibacter marinus]|uniref:sodium:solute symporter family transporter n=1 Tax=Labilibacter marinus TaxID=1477105 RepID=UPI00094F65B6|nr:sodium/solute symporter [Labilibacter marinus]